MMSNKTRRRAARQIHEPPEILFRKIGTPRASDWGDEVPSIERWHIEAYDPEWTVIPIGLMVVVTQSDFSPIVMYLWVIEKYRRKGVGTSLLNAARKRWAHLSLTDDTTPSGRKFLAARGWE